MTTHFHLLGGFALAANLPLQTAVVASPEPDLETDAGIRDRISRLLGQEEWRPYGDFSQDMRVLGDRFGLNPFPLALFFGNLGSLLPSLRPETAETRASLLHSFLKEARGQSEIVGRLANHLNGDDWNRRPQRRHQTLHETLDQAVSGLSLYLKMRASLPDQPLYNPMAFQAETEPIASLKLPGEMPESGYRLVLLPGINEAHGGFLAQLESSPESSKGEIVAKAGFHVGSTSLSIVQLQGRGKGFGLHRERLRPSIGETHPFDWLVLGLADWARRSGFRRIRGYGYRLNAALDAHFRDGKFTDQDRPHFKRLYDRRFRDLGFKPHPEFQNVYERDLLEFPQEETLLARLMQKAIRD